MSSGPDSHCTRELTASMVADARLHKMKSASTPALRRRRGRHEVGRGLGKVNREESEGRMGGMVEIYFMHM